MKLYLENHVFHVSRATAAAHAQGQPVSLRAACPAAPKHCPEQRGCLEVCRKCRNLSNTSGTTCARGRGEGPRLLPCRTGSQPEGILPSCGHWPLSGGILGHRNRRRGCSWHLVDGGQRGCLTPHRAQASPHTVTWSKMSLVLRLKNTALN